MEYEIMREYSLIQCIKIMTKYYFCYLVMGIYFCIVTLAYMINEKSIIFVGLALIILLPNPESYEEIDRRLKI
jgi:hypothetical protein